MGGSDPRGAMGLLSFYLGPISDLPARLQGPKLEGRHRPFTGWKQTQNSLGGWMRRRRKCAETERDFLSFLLIPCFIMKPKYRFQHFPSATSLSTRIEI